VLDVTRFTRTYRSLTRLRHILQVLAKHGFGYIVERVRLSHLLPLPHRWKAPSTPETQADHAARVVDMLEELGPTFVKFGQLLSTRPDVIPEVYIQHLRQLQDHVAPFDTVIARRVIEEELGAPIEELFREFAEQPLAAGSLAQVYDATTRDGKDVVVKVKRPNIERMVLADIDLLHYLAKLIEEHVSESRILQPQMLVEEFGRSIRREMDFIIEASSAERFHRQFLEHEKVRTPQVFWELTTSSVLTLERLSGHNITDTAALDDMGVDRHELAKTVADAFIQQFFFTGIFQADPHGGNLLVDEDGVLSIVDFGMVGMLSEELREHLATTLIATVLHQVEVIVEVYVELGVISPETDLTEFRRDLTELLDKYYQIPLAHIDQQRAFQELMALVRRHRVFLPRNFVLLAKAFVTVSGLSRELDPQFDLVSLCRPYARSLAMRKVSPETVGKSLTFFLWRLGKLLSRGPQDIRQLLDKALNGRLEIVFHHSGLTSFAHTLERTGNRLASSITLAAVLVSSTLLVTNGIGPKIGGFSALGVAGFVISGVMALLLAFAIWRSGR